MNIIQCYAPTNDHEEESKSQFYEQLDNLLNKLPNRDVNVLMGDFNAKTGTDNTAYERVMCRHGVGKMNNNGKRFVDTCAQYGLVIGGSTFQHKQILKITWISPDHSQEIKLTTSVYLAEVPKVTARC